MPSIIVSPLSQLDNQIAQHEPSQIITLTSDEVPQIQTVAKRLCLVFNDIIEPREGLILAQQSHIEELLEFSALWDQTSPLLIHCYAGISRSTAGAYICALALNLELDEELLALRLRELSPSATPNLRLIQLADDLLGKNGRMVDAINKIGRGADAFEGSAFRLIF